MLEKNEIIVAIIRMKGYVPKKLREEIPGPASSDVSLSNNDVFQAI